MFRNKALLVQTVDTKDKKKSKDDQHVESAYIEPDQINMIAKDFVSYTTTAVVGGLTAVMVVQTVCKIAVTITKSRFK